MGWLSWNEIDKDELKPGDHIYTRRRFYSHHGIYIGDGNVIHFTRKDGQHRCPVTSPSMNSMGFQQSCNGVIKSSLDSFLLGGKLYRFEYSVSKAIFLSKSGGTCSDVASDPLEVVLRRADCLLQDGFGEYDLVENNCEDFAIYCKTGSDPINSDFVGRSTQVKMWYFKTFGFVGGFSLPFMTLFAISQLESYLEPCGTVKCLLLPHEVEFLLATLLVSAVTRWRKPSLESFRADQFDEENPKERKQKIPFFNWWNFWGYSGLILGVAVLLGREHWIRDIVVAMFIVLSLILFVTLPVFRYRRRRRELGPLTPILLAYVAAFRKRSMPYPSDPALELYQVSKSDANSRNRLLCHTEKLRCLDKAAIVEKEEMNKENPWRQSTMAKVEETKLVVYMILILVTTIPIGVCIAQSSNFFIKQAVAMDSRVGGFLIPLKSFYYIASLGMIVSVVLYEKLIVPFLHRTTSNKRGLNILQRIGIGMFFSALTMAVAALVEARRLDEADRGRQLSVFWLAPQIVIMGFGDGFSLVSLHEYISHQLPNYVALKFMFYLCVIDAANFTSSLLITAVDRVTEKGGKSWFGEDLNSSRLDMFYWLLAALEATNLVLYVVLARRYSYKNVHKVAVADCY